MAPKRNYGVANPLVCGFCIFFVIGTSSAMAASKPVFLPPVVYNAGALGTEFVAVADVNGDNKPDLIVASRAPNGVDGLVAVLLGNGDGTFQAPVTYDSGGESPFSLAVADLNGDSSADIVVSNTASVGVLLGNGDGTLQSVVSYASIENGGGNSVAIGDLNNDGAPDVVTATTNGVPMFLGNGDGTFQAVVPVPQANRIEVKSVNVADVNGDGNADIVLGTESQFVGVLLGNGNGTFQRVVFYKAGVSVGGWTNSFAIADLNGDGKLDIAVANYPDSATGVLSGNGDGTFQPVVLYGSGAPFAWSEAIADVNGDGNPDLIVADFGGTIGILLGNGDGTFQNALTYNVIGGATSVAVADVNGDGRPDLLVTNGNSFVSVLLNNTPFCTTPPVVTISISRTSLWPPNGNMLPVTVSGRITDTTGCTVKSAAYNVTDEYGELQPSGPVTLGPGGAYSFTILLQASRLGADLDGRLYTITVSASNNAGKTGSQVGTIIVPHDQRH